MKAKTSFNMCFAACNQFSNSTWYFANNALVAWKSFNIFFKIWISTCVLWFQTDKAFGKCEHLFLERGHTWRINFGVTASVCDFWRDDYLSLISCTFLELELLFLCSCGCDAVLCWYGEKSSLFQDVVVCTPREMLHENTCFLS